MRWTRTTQLTQLALVLSSIAGCHGDPEFRCRDNSNCDLAPGGVCVAASTGNLWCAYPDISCDSGLRFSDSNVGDDLAGVCTEPGQTFKLTVVVGGRGMGTIASTPAGVACESGTCTYDFAAGTEVALDTTVSNGAFLGWSGACVGFDACTVVMDQDRTVSGLFGMRGEPLWVQQFGSDGSDSLDSTTGLAVDTDGDVIAAGYFVGTMQVGTFTLNANDGKVDMYLAKVDGLTGDVLWARSYGGPLGEQPAAVALDEMNNIYVAGNFAGAWDLGNGVQISATNATGMFVAKFSPNGDAVWAQSMVGTDYNFATDIAVRGGAIAMAGRFRGQLTADQTYGSHGYFDVFIAKLTTNGGYVWTKRIGENQIDSVGGIGIDNAGNVIVGGSFGGTVDFGGGAKTSNNSSTDMFVARYASTNGAHLFSKAFGSSNNDILNGLALAANDGVVFTGRIGGSTDFGGPSPLIPADDSGDMYLVNLTAAGAWRWGKTFASTGGTMTSPYENATSLTTNSLGEVAVVGYFCGTISFGGDGLTSASSCDSVQQYDAFAAKFSSAGDHLNSVRVGGTGSESAEAVALTRDGRYLLGGDFEGFADFGTGQTLTSKGSFDGFCLMLAPL